MILNETIDILKNRHNDYLRNLSISEVRIGLYMSAVKLSDGSVGLSTTYKALNSEIHCKKENRDFGSFTPNRISGKSVIDLLESTKKNGIVETLKVAVLNAISSGILKNSDYTILRNTDPVDLIDLKSRKTITIIGAFQSYIQKISKTDNRLFVLEFNENTLEEKDRKYYVPASYFSEILPVSDIVIITGLTLVNNTLEDLLRTIKPEAQTIITGPSSSFIPDVLFANNVNIIGAVSITKPDLILKLVSEGGAGYHMFRYGAEKICILSSVCP